MYIRTPYLTCFGSRRAIINGQTFNEWGFILPRGFFAHSPQPQLSRRSAGRAADPIDRTEP